MAHIDGVVTWTWTVIQHTFFQNWLVKLTTSFFTILLWLITNWNEFIIWSIFLIYFIDLFTWVWCAIYNRNFQSRKFFMWCTKLLVYWIFMVIGVTVWQTLHIWNALLSSIFWFILVTDSISIIENLEKLWYNTPFVLKKYLKDYQNILKHNKKDDEK